MRTQSRWILTACLTVMALPSIGYPFGLKDIRWPTLPRLPLPAVTAPATPVAEEPELGVSTQTTSDSSIEIRVRLEPEQGKAVILVYPERDRQLEAWYELPLQDGRASKKVYLAHGPGNYRISVLNPNWTVRQSQDVRNLDQEKLDCLGFETRSTDDSSLRFRGRVAPDIRSVWLQVEKEGGMSEKVDHFPALSDGRLEGMIYLKDGPGAYKVTCRVTAEETPGRTYPLLSSFVAVNTDRRDTSYLLPSANVQSDDPNVRELAISLSQGLGTEREKVRAIHDWVARNVAYDAEGFLSGDYVNRPQDAAATLRLRTGVCSGFAQLSAALLRAAGIRTKVVEGVAVGAGPGVDPAQGWATVDRTKVNHAWNEVWVDGKWMLLDVTWDGGHISPGTGQYVFALRHEFFDPVPEDFARSHEKLRDTPY